MLASHWVIEDIVKAIDSKNKKKIENALKGIFEKYPADKEIVEMGKEYMEKKDSKLLSKMKKRLKELYEERKMESSSGGSNLWFGDRRGHGEQTLR